MKISRIRSQILVMPQDDPLADTPEDRSMARPIVIVRLDTDDGIEGIGVTFYGGAITAALKRAVDDLGALTIGEDPLRVEAIIAKLRAAAGGSGPAGMFTMALAALDIALWDIRGKALGPAAVEAAGRGAAAGARLCQRRLAPPSVDRRGRGRGRKAQGQGLSRDEDAARPARRHLARQGGRAHACGCARRSGPTSS